MEIYYFAYGANLSDKELEKYSFRYDWKKFCYLENFELKLNHFSIPFLIPSYFNIESKKKSKVYGILYKTTIDDLNKLKKKELFYKIIPLNIKIDGKNYESVTFQSIITNNCHQKITKNYKSKVLNSLKKYNVPKSYLDKINNLKYFNINFFLISFLILLIYIIKCNLI
jgi:histidyl-tRNA synthetase